MKQYGANKATEFSKKQIGVIYRMAKQGDVKVERWVMSELYDLAEYYGYDDNKSVEEAERHILEMLDDAFSGDNEGLQKKLDTYTSRTWELLGKKAKATCNREYV